MAGHVAASAARAASAAAKTAPTFRAFIFGRCMCSTFLSSKIPLFKLSGHRNASRVVLAARGQAPVLAGEDWTAVVVAQAGGQGADPGDGALAGGQVPARHAGRSSAVR